jgi:hypothetical protein
VACLKHGCGELPACKRPYRVPIYPAVNCSKEKARVYMLDRCTHQRARLAFLIFSTNRAKCRWARCFNSSTGSSQSLMPICSSVVQPS